MTIPAIVALFLCCLCVAAIEIFCRPMDRRHMENIEP